MKILPAIRKLNGRWPQVTPRETRGWDFRKRCHQPQPRPTKTEKSESPEWVSEGWQPPWEKSKADFQSTPITAISTPNAHVFKELGQPKVGHTIKPKGKLSRPQLSCHQPEDKADYRGRGEWFETGGFRIQKPALWYLESQLPWAIFFLKSTAFEGTVKATKLCEALLSFPASLCQCQSGT